MTEIPQAAIDAAIDAVMTARELTSDHSRAWARPIVTEALRAATPVILREAAKPQFEQAIRELADAEFRKRVPETLAVIEDSVGAALYPRVAEIAEAAKKAERERIIGIASQLRASIPADRPLGAQASFADYLRVMPADGGQVAP